MALNKPPSDIISKIVFADNSHLLVSSWDKSISLYNTDSNSLMFSLTTEAPLLDCNFYLVFLPGFYYFTNSQIIQVYGSMVVSRKKSDIMICNLKKN